MGKYIIDVTQLVHWHGRLTGIPRVVQELAVRFPENSDSEVIFASWVKEINDMCEVDLASTLAMRGNGIKYLKNGEVAQTVQGESVSQSTPQKYQLIKNKSKRLAKKVLVKSRLDRLDVTKVVLKKRYETSMQDYKRVAVGSGDIFFIGAGEWWDQNFINLIVAYKQKSVKIVQVSHDLLPIVTPQFAGHATDSLSSYNAQVFPVCDLVLAVSESTKRDAIKWLETKGLPVPKIETFRLGEDFAAAAPTKPNSKPFVETNLKGSDYILSVGTIEARKNHALLYYTYKLAISRGVELPKILIVGRRGWKTDDVYEYLTNDPETKDNLVPLHDVSDEELSWLYDNCLFTIYPSFYEGWGMPIAESIMRGAPCLASNTSSMIEVAPNHADYFNPSSTDELLDGIISMLEPGTLAKKRKHLATYKATTWDDSFKQVKVFLEKL